MSVQASDILEAIRASVPGDPARIVPEAKLRALDLSSLDLITALFEIEDRFGVIVAPEDVADASTVGDVIETALAKAAAG